MLRIRLSGWRLRAASLLIVLGCLATFTFGHTLAQRDATGDTSAALAQAAHVLGSAFASQGTAPTSRVSPSPSHTVSYTNLPSAAPPTVHHEGKGDNDAHRYHGGHSGKGHQSHHYANGD
jgi:hypothetical protein